MLCWPYARIALQMTILLAHNPMVSVRALKGGCHWKNQLFRVRDRPPVVPLYVDAPGVFSRRKTYQGKSQSPGARRAGGGETNLLNPLDRLIYGMGASLQALAQANAQVANKMSST